MELKEGLTVIICTLNSEKDLSKTLESLMTQTLKPSQIIVADGGSTDQTEKIAREYSSVFLSSQPGFFNQVTNSFPFILHKTLFCAECDHIYPNYFLENIYIEHKALNSVGTQGALTCVKKDNYYEKAFSYLYEKNQKFRKVNFISGPAIWDTKTYINIYSELSKMQSPELLLFSIDTFISEVIKKEDLNCYKIDVYAHQYQELNFKIITTKYFKYGEGDYFYYNSMKSKWTFSKKLMSLTHVFRNHFLKLSLLALRDFKIHYIPFFMLTSFYRQWGFYSKYLKYLK